jgi:hypothetical protein
LVRVVPYCSHQVCWLKSRSRMCHRYCKLILRTW